MERRFFLFHILITFYLLLSCNSFAQDSLEIDSIQFIQDSIEIERLKKEGIRFASQGDYDAAIEKFDSILLIDPNDFKARNNLGIIYKRLGRHNDALKVYSEAEDIVRRECGPLCLDLGYLYMNIGIIYNDKQDYELALQYLNFAENIFKDLNITTERASSVYNNIGHAFFGMNDARKALRSFQKGVEVKKVLESRNLHISYANCASAYEKLEKFDSASIYYNYSIQAKIKLESDTHYILIKTYNNYGVLLQKMDSMELALDYFQMALRIAKSYWADKHSDIAESYRRIASWYMKNGEAELAIDYYQKGLNAVVYDYNEKDVFDNPDLEDEIMSEPILLEILLGKAQGMYTFYKEKGDQEVLLASLNTLELANKLSEKMRSSFMGEASKLLITEYARTGFDRSVRISYDLYMLTGDEEFANKAFISAEKSKSSVLLAGLQEVERKKNVGIPAEIQVYEQDLKWETDIYKKKLYEEKQRETPDQKNISDWQEKLLNLSQELDSIDQHIREEFPEYAEKFDNEVIGLNGIMEALDSDQVLIEYSMSDTCLFIFVIAKDEFFITKTKIDSVFHKQVRVLSEFLRDNDFANNTLPQYLAYTEAAYALYQSFLLPVEEQIKGKKLLIIPDGELGYIPFEALLTEPPSKERMDYRNLPYLIYKYRTNYSYSATLYFSEQEKRTDPDKQLLAFAPTYENVHDIDSDKFPANRNFSTSLVPLRFISTEIQNISEIIDCDRFEGYEATEKVFKEEAPKYDILHLAMHTLINDENPLYSQLVFTLNNDTLEENDGLLNAYEIFNMQLSARMAVLSACNTGSGKLQKGEGIMSMARGFIFAGVPSIIMTLWAVEDQSGSILMSKFYQNLEEGLRIDEALQEAKLQYLQEADQLSAHPYLWSGYVSIGSTDALISQDYSKIYQLIIGVVGLVIIILVLLRLRNRKVRA